MTGQHLNVRVSENAKISGNRAQEITRNSLCVVIQYWFATNGTDAYICHDIISINQLDDCIHFIACLAK